MLPYRPPITQIVILLDQTLIEPLKTGPSDLKKFYGLYIRDLANDRSLVDFNKGRLSMLR